jgi:hypothetical protein
VLDPLIDIIGAVPLRELTAATVRLALKDLAATRATRTVAMAHAGLTRAIRHAEANDKVRRNVATAEHAGAFRSSSPGGWGVGGRFAVGWFLPRGDQPQLPGDDLQGARGRDGNQRRHEGAEEAAEPVADRRSDQD